MHFLLIGPIINKGNLNSFLLSQFQVLKFSIFKKQGNVEGKGTSTYIRSLGQRPWFGSSTLPLSKISQTNYDVDLCSKVGMKAKTFSEAS